MQLVAGGEDERDRASPRQSLQFIDLLGMVIQFLSISATKLAPADCIMSEPTPKIGARRNFLQPAIDGRVGLLHPARPEPVDENANAIIGSRGLVGSLQPDVLLCDPAHLRLLQSDGDHLLEFELRAVLSRLRSIETTASLRPSARGSTFSMTSFRLLPR